MICTSQSVDMEIERQGQDHLYPEPCFYISNNGPYLHHPNLYPMIPGSGNPTNIDLRHFPNNHDSNMFYGSHFNGIQHHNPFTTTEFGASSGFHNPCMIPPSGGRLFPVPHVSTDQLTSSSHSGIVGVPTDEFGANHFMDGFRGSGKRKTAELIPGNYHQVNGSESSSSSSLGMQMLSTNVHQSEERLESGATLVDAAASVPPEYIVNGIPPTTGTRSGRSVRSRSNMLDIQMESTVMNNGINHFAQGNYVAQSFQPPSWVEQQFRTTGNDGSTSTWNYPPAMPYVNGGNVNGGPSESPNMGGQGYPGTISSRNSPVILNPPMLHNPHPHHHFHPPPPAMQAVHAHNNYNLQPLFPSFRHPTNNVLHHATTNNSLDDSEVGSRSMRPFPSNGLRVYRPHRNGLQPPVTATARPHLRFMSEEEVALLEIPGYYEVGTSTDRHRDMRLDIDDMSYEELLDLGERIGNVITGLPEETILSHLKTKWYSPMAVNRNQDMETCVVCQVEYNNQEKVAILDCGHQYHVDCIKRWLQVKNVCPICKVPAINGEDGQTAM